jgi:hypothetical protein
MSPRESEVALTAFMRLSALHPWCRHRMTYEPIVGP